MKERIKPQTRSLLNFDRRKAEEDKIGCQNLSPYNYQNGKKLEATIGLYAFRNILMLHTTWRSFQLK